MTLYIIHGVEECDTDTGHDIYYESCIYRVFKSLRKAEKFEKGHPGHITKINVTGE